MANTQPASALNHDNRAADLPQPTRRVIVLGASNVALAVPVIVSVARHLWPEPLDILLAGGHGRSYGLPSTVLGRKIPGILSSQLWEDLAHRPPLPTAALVTDIGTDILYGRDPDLMLEWVFECLDRLGNHQSQTMVTELPVTNTEGMSEARYRFFRKLFFPKSGVSLATARTHALRVNERLRELAEAKKYSVFPVQNEWYGYDPVHVHRRYQCAAWSVLLSHDNGALREPLVRRPTWRESIYLRSLPPSERQIWGYRQCRAQPSGHLADGTTISLY